MLHLGLPHVNLLSKMDVMHQYKDKLLFGIDFYTDVLDLQYLLEALDEDPFSKRSGFLPFLYHSTIIPTFTRFTFSSFDVLFSDTGS